MARRELEGRASMRRNSGFDALRLLGSLTDMLRRSEVESDEEAFVRELPAAPGVVANLPKRRLTAADIPRTPEDKQACSICMENFKAGDHQRTLPCFHNFHVRCVDKWLVRQGTCPNCKQRVDTLVRDGMAVEDQGSASDDVAAGGGSRPRSRQDQARGYSSSYSSSSFYSSSSSSERDWPRRRAAEAPARRSGSSAAASAVSRRGRPSAAAAKASARRGRPPAAAAAAKAAARRGRPSAATAASARRSQPAVAAPRSAGRRATVKAKAKAQARPVRKRPAAAR